MSSQDVSRYRWSRAYGLRLVAISVVVLAVVWVVAALSGFASWALVLVVVFAVVTAGCFVLVVVPPTLLELSTEGYRLRHVRGGGAMEARWSEVASVAGGTSAEGAVMSIELGDDRTTVVPLVLLGARAVIAERDIHDRLNRVHGYRRLGDS